MNLKMKHSSFQEAHVTITLQLFLSRYSLQVNFQEYNDDIITRILHEILNHFSKMFFLIGSHLSLDF
jgi:hypothetical protein